MSLPWFFRSRPDDRDRPGDEPTPKVALLEALDAELATPPCKTCGERMKRRRGVAKTLDSRFRSAKVRRMYCTCRTCGGGCFLLDRALGLEGKSAAPWAESMQADAASSDSYEEASRMLRNLASADVSKATLRRRSLETGQEMQAFEREDVEAASPTAERILVGIDGTGVPMVASEVEGVAGMQEDGSGKTREAKTIICCTASRDPKTGELRKDNRAPGRSASASTAHGREAATAGHRTSPPAWSRPRRNGVFKANELVLQPSARVGGCLETPVRLTSGICMRLPARRRDFSRMRQNSIRTVSTDGEVLPCLR